LPYKLSLIVVLLFMVTACASGAESSNAAAPTEIPPTTEAASVDTSSPVAVAQADPAGLPTDESGEELVARVNGEGITRADFDRMLARTQQQILVADEETLLATVLDTLIEQMLIEQQAAIEGVIITDEAVEAEFQATKALVDSEDAWTQWLAENLYTEDEFRQSLRETLIASAMRDRVVQDMPETLPQVHARHILVRSEDEAQDVLQRLQNGEDFATLAASLSQDVTTREQGGDLGWFAEGELLEPALSDAAFALDVGAVSSPVPTRLGYHIIQTLEAEERPVAPEKRALLAQVQFENWVRRLSFNAIIERYLP
jgi:peptidyl-prolyl cis-trans isomerase C